MHLLVGEYKRHGYKCHIVPSENQLYQVWFHMEDFLCCLL